MILNDIAEARASGISEINQQNTVAGMQDTDRASIMALPNFSRNIHILVTVYHRNPTKEVSKVINYRWINQQACKAL